jgi:hypothetical protein
MSEDDTVDVAMSFPFVRVVSCLPGRARQMNFGAAHALAPVLWFLHVDSTLPEKRTVDALIDAMEDPELVGGAFRFHLRGSDRYFRFVNMLINWRTRVTRRPFGDQGIFARAEAFRSISGFRELDCCEDLDLVLRLRKLGRFQILRPLVETSARTWVKYGKVATTMYHVKQMFFFELRRRFGLLRERPQLAPPPAPELESSEQQPASEPVTDSQKLASREPATS